VQLLNGHAASPEVAHFFHQAAHGLGGYPAKFQRRAGGGGGGETLLRTLRDVIMATELSETDDGCASFRQWAGSSPPPSGRVVGLLATLQLDWKELQLAAPINSLSAKNHGQRKLWAQQTSNAGRKCLTHLRGNGNRSSGR
jgi:hypothetical protein